MEMRRCTPAYSTCYCHELHTAYAFITFQILSINMLITSKYLYLLNPEHRVASPYIVIRGDMHSPLPPKNDCYNHILLNHTVPCKSKVCKISVYYLHHMHIKI